MANVYKDTPWGAKIDSDLCSHDPAQEYQKQGSAKLTHEHDWTAVDFWDRSVDTRYGSHSAFVIAGTHSFDDMMKLAKIAFPWVFARLNFEVFLSDRSI